MADQNDANPTQHAKSRPEPAETQPPRNDLKEQRGGPQSDQRTGQTDKGANNQDMKGRNPRGNKTGDHDYD